jgi:hypothetical protein
LDNTGTVSDRGIRYGNGLVPHNDGSKIVVTTDDGSLHIVRTTTPVRTLAVYEPAVTEDFYTACRSKPTIIYKEQQSQAAAVSSSSSSSSSDYIVYAVIDTPIASGIEVGDDGLVEPTNKANTGTIRSRVLAVNMDGTIKWDVQVLGVIQGDVVVGRNDALYVSHNINDIGHLSVIMANENTDAASVVATVTSADTAPNGPFGPPALHQDESSGDVVFVAESWGQGYVEGDGGLYMLSTTSEFEDTGGIGNESYQLQRISSWPYSSIVPPLVDGNSIFLGASGGVLGAWTGNERNDLSGIQSGRVDEIDPRWVYAGERNWRNESQRTFGCCKTLGCRLSRFSFFKIYTHAPRLSPFFLTI